VLPAQIAPEGWSNWDNKENEKTATYVEANNTGIGANTSQRAGWVKLLKFDEAKSFTLDNIFESTGVGSNDLEWYKSIKLKSFDWPISQ
jgi:pectinesterase